MLIKQDWKFDYFYDFNNHGQSVHGIYDNGKTFQCKHDIDTSCQCFSRVSFAHQAEVVKFGS